MPARKLDLLLIEDDNDHAELLTSYFSLALGGSRSLVLSRAKTLAEALSFLARRTFDLVLLDLGLPESTGLNTLDAVLPNAGKAPVVVLTAEDSVELGIAAVQSGAQDYLPKSHLQPLLIQRSVLHAIERNRVQLALADAKELAELRNRELSEANAELEHFVQAASHDLQEPMRTPLSYMVLLEDDLGDKLAADTKQDLALVVKGANRVNGLIQDLLRLSRTGRSKLETAEVDIAECVGESLEALRVRLDERAATVTQDALPKVRCDRRLLTQTFQNLIGNALKFGPTNGATIKITAQQQGDEWLLGVRDNGIGIDKRHAKKIFEPFERLHGVYEYEGSGVGLAICRKAIERHGGRIWVESEPGKGSHFQFTLSAHTEDLKTAGAAASPAL